MLVSVEFKAQAIEEHKGFFFLFFFYFLLLTGTIHSKDKGIIEALSAK